MTSKELKAERDKLYRKTPKGLITQIYGAQRNSSKKRGHKMPTYTKEELVLWLAKENFIQLYIEWQQSQYSKDTRPSVDRLDDTQGYTLTNIQLITWKENNDKARKAQSTGKLWNGQELRAVIQLNLISKYVSEFKSARDAERQLNLSKGAVSACCHQKRQTAGGYKWQFKIV